MKSKQNAESGTVERNLSKNEARIILDLEWRGQGTVTLADLRDILGASDSYVRYLAHRLVKKGWLERLRPGLYQLVPASRGREGIADSNPLAAGAVLVEPYFFSFGTACTYHGLTEQVFAEVYIACQEWRHPEIIRGKRYFYVNVPPARYFGFKEVSVLGHPVRMATLDRALLDAIDRPRFAGGIGEVSRIVSRSIVKLSWDALVASASRYGSSALVQRLGYFLDLHHAEVPEAARAALVSMVRPGSKIQLGSRRRWGTSGKLVRPWNVTLNVPLEVLLSNVERRRRVFVRPRNDSR
ncbi:MAG: type IV toxin-antitoxin system AbiEi family antitoxin domain-containing protein [Candidatus Eisenbacteria bacterium]|uniref:Type IV toxin-antitoxin system AbiEi family antitoxin domain-containing protein n=1 Tax=Eiseniibacteriota bacterium TaxID=2212470 RepID=A0A937XCB7_UNCEI|nr:type IV toxin-antitoxin system AbiEi family antitoxin domain-containing protein [Candidatus Eisenbacteria bacterium]